MFDGDPGFVAVKGEVIQGAVGFNFKHEGLLYAHSLFSNGDAAVAARLFQKVRKEAKRLGYSSIDFVVSADHAGLLRLLQKGRGRMKQVWMEIGT